MFHISYSVISLRYLILALCFGQVGLNFLIGSNFSRIWRKKLTLARKSYWYFLPYIPNFRKDQFGWNYLHFFSSFYKIHFDHKVSDNINYGRRVFLRSSIYKVQVERESCIKNYLFWFLYGKNKHWFAPFGLRLSWFVSMFTCKSSVLW